MRSKSKYGISQGFTLVEILIAILIFGIIVTTVFASHRSVFVSAPVIDDGIDLYEMAGVCLERIAIDLRSIHIDQPPAYAKPDSDAPPDPYRFVAREEDERGNNTPRLRFTSLAHLSFEQIEREGIAEIAYYDTPFQEDVYQLRRADNLYPYPDFEEKESDPVLCQGVKKLDISYYDDEGNEHTYWNSESDEFDYATPVSIAIKVEIEHNTHTAVFETRVALPVVRDGME